MHRDLAYFSDILQSAEMAIKYLNDIEFEEFTNNIMLQDSVIRRIEIIGEASSGISKESQKQYADLPWREMKGMRNLLIHEYDDVNLDVIWNTVKKELPPLVEEIKSILN